MKTSSKQAAPRSVGQVRLATYNVRDLFLRHEGPAKPGTELRPLLRMVAQVDADVLVMQEVGSLASLTELNQRLAQPYVHLGLVEGNSDRSIHIGVLSRLPVRLHSFSDVVLKDEQGAQLEGYRHERDAVRDVCAPLLVQRNFLRIDVLGLADDLTLYGVHLKSRGQSAWQAIDSELIRAAEVRALAGLLQDAVRDGKALLAVLGDFNDYPGSASMRPLSKLGLADPQGVTAARLGRNPSTFWARRGMRFDRILLSRAAQRRLVASSPTIHSNRMAQTASDHYPVSLALNIHRAGE